MNYGLAIPADVDIDAIEQDTPRNIKAISDALIVAAQTLKNYAGEVFSESVERFAVKQPEFQELADRLIGFHGEIKAINLAYAKATAEVIKVREIGKPSQGVLGVSLSSEKIIEIQSAALELLEDVIAIIPNGNDKKEAVVESLIDLQMIFARSKIQSTRNIVVDDRPKP